jgi:hypothetical protein
MNKYAWKARIVLPHHHEAIRLEITQWSQHSALHHAEHGGVRADSKSESKNGDGSETRVLVQHA